MKVAYFYCSMLHGNDPPEQRQMAALSIASVRRHMPGVEVVHLTDHRTKTLADADSVIACQWGADTNRADLHAMLHGEILYLDTDTIVLSDLRGVFDDKAFQVAVAKRQAATWREDYRYNGGVIFCRDEHVWHDVASGIRDEKQDPETAFNRVLLSGKFSVKELPETFNYSPPHDIRVMHFKGAEQRTMLRLFGVAA